MFVQSQFIVQFARSLCNDYLAHVASLNLLHDSPVHCVMRITLHARPVSIYCSLPVHYAIITLHVCLVSINCEIQPFTVQSLLYMPGRSQFIV